MACQKLFDTSEDKEMVSEISIDFWDYIVINQIPFSFSEFVIEFTNA